MRLAAAQKVHYDSGPNMTPLVDVVMVILIFMMLAGTFAGMTHFLRSTTAVGTGGPCIGVPRANIDLRVPAQSEGQFSVAVAGTGSVSSDEALTGRLEVLKNGLLAQGRREEDIVVVIRPDRGVTYQTLVKVHSAALAAKVNKIAFATAP